ncbi:MAG: hypothetical protein EOO48_01860 [Flavobacterium sp.]|nr:MAG: hypothetical protein EOO48_01860 [Flavobacterium sp.]
MTSADYTFLLNQPAAINDRQTESLEKIVAEFPYFQSARALRLKGLYNQNSFQYNFALKVAAAYTTDRSVLFDFITSDTFTAIHKGLYDQKLAELHDMDVEASEIVIEQEQAEAPKVDLVEASILTSIKESESPYSEQSDVEEVAFDLQEEPETEAEPIIDEIIPASEIELISEIPSIDAFEEIEFVPVESLQTTEIEPADKTEETAPADEAVETTDEITETSGPIEPEVQTPEEKLHIGEPLAFSKTETHSFQEWLQLSKLQPIHRDEKKAETEAVKANEVSAEPTAEIIEDDVDPKFKKNAIIDRFIETNPKIPKMKPDAEPVASPELKEVHSSLMTETLARVYLEQKKYQKAIQAYEILILKYPEKSSFFADRISEIKSLQQNT